MSNETKPLTVRFTIDGQQFTTDQEHRTSTELLSLVGFDAATYDLAEITPHGQVRKFQDNQNVHIKGGEEFVTVRQEAPVA